MKSTWIPLFVLTLVAASCSKPPHRIVFKGGDASGTIDGGDGNGNSTAADGTLSLAFSTAFPRISHLQWDNSVRDILLLDQSPDLSKNFTPDPSGSAYGNNSALLKVSATLWADYRNAAETIAVQVTTDQAKLKKLLPASLPSDETAKAKAIVTPLARRAYRRPPTDDEVTKLVAFYKNGLKESDNKDATAAGLEAVITVLLQSPAFIYRTELGDDTGRAEVELNAYEVASRLSFALWNTIPDETLLKAADSGALLKVDVLKAQVARMVNDPKGEATIAYFHEKSFNIAKFVGLTKDAKTFPKWPTDLGDTLKNEAAMFLGEVVKTGGGVKEIFTAPYTFVNDKTAPLYGVKAPNGATLTKVDLDPNQRAGILTQIGYLASKGHDTENDPIHRGTYVVGEVLCTQLSAPPNVGEVPPPNDKLKTVRDRVNALTTPAGCAGCHQTRINPAGFAFEHYDSTGTWRDKDGDSPVIATGEYQFIGTSDPSLKFDGAIQFIKGLIQKPDVHACYVQKAMEMLYGQRPGAPEQDLISALATKSNGGASIKDLFVEIMTDPRVYQRSNQEAK